MEVRMNWLGTFAVGLLVGCAQAEAPDPAQGQDSAQGSPDARQAHPDGALGALLADDAELHEVEQYLAEQARQMPRKLSIGSRPIPLPDDPLLIRADRERFPSRPADSLSWLASEYTKLAAEQVAASATLTIPAQLRSPDYLFGLETRSAVLWLHTGAEPALYTVSSRAGEVLAEGIPGDELEQRFPEFTGFELLGATDLRDD